MVMTVICYDSRNEGKDTRGCVIGMAEPFWHEPRWMNLGKFAEDCPRFDGYEFDFSIVPDGWDEEVELYEAWLYPSTRLINPTGAVAKKALGALKTEHGRQVIKESLGEYADEAGSSFEVWYHVWGYERGRLLDDEEDDEQFGPYCLKF